MNVEIKQARLRLEIVTGPAELQRLAPAWAQLVRQSGDPQPMIHPRWMLNWLTHYGADCQPVVGLLYDNDTMVGLAPFCRSIVWHRPGLPFRRIELMGASSDRADGVRGEFLNLIAVAGREGEVANAFIGALHLDAFGRWDECILDMLGEDAPMTRALEDEFSARGLPVTPLRHDDAYYVTLPADWDAYLKARHGKRRNWFRRTLRKFEEWLGDDGYELHRASDARSLREGMDVLTRLHAERWASDGQRGVFASERFSAFHRDYASAMLAAGELDLLWLTVRGQAVAAHYSFVTDGRICFYQSGRAMNVPDEVQIGTVMFVLALQDAMARGLREYDFLAGDGFYKSHFTSEKRPLTSLRIARNSLRETTRSWSRTCVRSVRHTIATGTWQSLPNSRS